MNDTNRALNRILLAVFGLVLLGLGALVVLAVISPVVGDAWRSTTQAGVDGLVQASDSTRIADASASWLGVGVVAALVIVVALLVVVLAKLGGRRSRTVLQSSGSSSALGRVTVTEAFAADALKNSLAGDDDVLSTTVTAHTVGPEPVMHVSITPRQNTDPRGLVARVDRLVTNLAHVTGRETATYISIHSGLRAKIAGDQRRVT